MRLPATGAYVLRNARVPAALASGLELREAAAGFALADLAVADGRLLRPGQGRPAEAVDLAGRIVLPPFADLHTHLDKAYTVQRTGPARGGLMDAIAKLQADAPERSAADLHARMTRGIEAALAHGTGALRTHLDTYALPDETPAWEVFDDLGRAWSGRIALQAAALFALDRAGDADFPARCAQIARRGGVLGAFVAPGPARPDLLAAFLAGAARHGLDVDFHVDETLDPASDGLERIAEAVLATRFAHRVTVGHCCALSVQADGDAARIVAAVARAGLHVVSLPHTNLCLQDRAPGRTPRRRGLTLVQELAAAGVPVSFASDNVQDAFHPFGDHDLLEVAGSAIRAAQLDADIAPWLAAVTLRPSAAMGLAGGRLAAGGAADFTLFSARDPYALFSLPQQNRIVVRAGLVAAKPLTEAVA